MPRLEGKRSNSGLYIILVIVALLAILVLLEFLGVSNLINNFGAE